MYKFGAWLRDRRTAAGLSQVELASALEVKQQSVSDWERGATRPHVSRGKDLDRALRLPSGTTAAAIASDGGDDDAPDPAPPGGAVAHLEGDGWALDLAAHDGRDFTPEERAEIAGYINGLRRRNQ